ncbi:Survival protein SurE-like phosphatase/nucleotidase [Naviculisporaceae sp. PSN 640]
MHAKPALVALLSLLAANTAQGIRIIQSNDDGWAELYVRSFHDALIAAGHDAVLSAPADNMSGTSSLDIEPLPRRSACQYSSCPSSSNAPIGRNTTSPRLNWVNSFPVTAMRYGIDTIGPQHWNGQAPELAVSGPNVGSNLWLQVPFSGTVGTAVYASKQAGIPGIAFSGTSGGTLAWNTSPLPLRSSLYAQLATIFTNRIIEGGKPYLPNDVWLNVNFPEVEEGKCDSLQKFTWVLSRINPGIVSKKDVMTCGTDRLPTETDVASEEGCFISVSVGDSNDKTTVDAERQKIVLDRLGGFLGCLP